MRDIFFNKKFEFLTLERVLEITGAKPSLECDLNLKITDVATLENADKSKISFLNSGQYFSQFSSSNAGFCFIEEKYATKSPEGMIGLIHKNPYLAYSQMVAAFYEEKRPDFSNQNSIHPTAKIGDGSSIGAGAYIGKNCVIGKNCFIAPNAVIMDGVRMGDNVTVNSGAVISFALIGNNCVFHNGAKIGQDGFGFVHNAGKNEKILQIGIVEIGDDVEIGANSCIDRGAIENTIISKDVKIDNLVQIAHNVSIGQGTVIAGCVGIAGSAKIGRFVQIGGGASIAGHIEINDGAKIAGMTGVMRDIPKMEVVAGIPSVPIRNWHRINSKLMAMIKKNDQQ